MKITKNTMIVALAAAAATSPAVPSFSGLGDAAGGDYWSHAHAISGNGQWIVGATINGSGTVAARWSAGLTMTQLGDLPGGYVDTRATGVNYDGSVIVGHGWAWNNERPAFRWTQGGGFVVLNDYAGGEVLAGATGVSADGTRVAGSGRHDSGDAMTIWTTTNPSTLGDLPGGAFDSEGLAINAAGTVVVGIGTDADGERAAVWVQGVGVQALSLPSGAGPSAARDVSDDGNWIVGQLSLNGHNEATLWNRSYGTYEFLGHSPGASTISANATAISANGKYVVGTDHMQAPWDERAMFWDRVNGMRGIDQILAANNVSVGTWKLDWASDVYASATEITVVGWGTNPQGNTEGFVAKFPRPKQVLTGQVALQDFIEMNGQQVQIGVMVGEFYVDDAVATLDSAGRFSVETEVPIGSYDVIIKGSHWLQKRVAGVAFGSTNANCSTSLTNGDINNDNEVGIEDFSALSFSYNSFEGDWNWNNQADLNGDGGVEITDYAILSQSYGLFGDS